MTTILIHWIWKYIRAHYLFQEKIKAERLLEKELKRKKREEERKEKERQKEELRLEKEKQRQEEKVCILNNDLLFKT